MLIRANARWFTLPLVTAPLLLSSCATAAPIGPPVAVELEVTDLREEEADVLRQEVEKIPGGPGR